MESRISNNCDKKSTLLHRLENYKDINEVFICSPFLTENQYLKFLIEKEISTRLVIRLCESTDCTLLRQLLKNSQIEVRFFNNRFFHSKLYIIDNSDVIMGSSNFTTNGLTENQELNILIQKNNACFEELVKIGNEYWNNAQVLDINVVKKLEELFSKYGKSSDDGLEDEISKITSHIKKNREFSSIHKARISAANKGKKDQN